MAYILSVVLLWVIVAALFIYLEHEDAKARYNHSLNTLRNKDERDKLRELIERDLEMFS